LKLFKLYFFHFASSFSYTKKITQHKEKPRKYYDPKCGFIELKEGEKK